MDRKFQFVPAAVCALIGALCLSSAAFGQNLPDGKGKAEFIHNCTACHSAGMVLRANKTPDEWRKTVDDMVARGTDGSKEDIDNVVLYLDKYFVTDKPGAATTTQSATPPTNSSGPAATASPESERAKRIVANGGCLACHRVEKQGAYTGPSLNGVASRRTADEIRTAIVYPNPTLAPNHSLVRLTTADGKTVLGRILSQSDQDVRVISSAGETTTYPKAGLRQFTIVDSNPMPSYEGRIGDEDLDVLVRYLSSLPSVDESGQK